MFSFPPLHARVGVSAFVRSIVITQFGVFSFRNDRLDEKEFRSLRRGAADTLQDACGFFITPIMDDLHDQIRITDRQGVLKEAPSLKA